MADFFFRLDGITPGKCTLLLLASEFLLCAGESYSGIRRESSWFSVIGDSVPAYCLLSSSLLLIIGALLLLLLWVRLALPELSESVSIAIASSNRYLFFLLILPLESEPDCRLEWFLLI